MAKYCLIALNNHKKITYIESWEKEKGEFGEHKKEKINNFQ